MTNGVGFRPGAPATRIRRITYGDDTDLAGLVIRIGGVSFGEWMTAGPWAQALDLFVDRLVEWNYVDDDGRPVPATREGVTSSAVDAALLKTVVADWLSRATDVVPLARARRTPAPAAAAGPSGSDPDLEATLSMMPVS